MSDRLLNDLMDADPYLEDGGRDTDDDATQEEGLAVGLEQFDITKHDCVVTLVLPPTERHPQAGHRTFKIATVKEGKGDWSGKRVVSLLVGPDNTADFSGFAFVKENGIVKAWGRLCGQDKPSKWENFSDLLSYPNYWAAQGVTYAFSLRCRRCGHPLTHPDSLATGYGPICITKV